MRSPVPGHQEAVRSQEPHLGALTVFFRFLLREGQKDLPSKNDPSLSARQTPALRKDGRLELVGHAAVHDRAVPGMESTPLGINCEFLPYLLGSLRRRACIGPRVLAALDEDRSNSRCTPPKVRCGAGQGSSLQAYSIAFRDSAVSAGLGRAGL